MRSPRLLLAALLAALAFPASAAAIVGGTVAPPGKYPAMAALLEEGSQICGASLVAPEWILTAAHCVTGDADAVTDPARLSFVLGRPDLKDKSAGEEIKAVQVLRHERYGDPDAASNDVALVRLERASGATPIRLADPATEKGAWAPGMTATVIGYGGTFFPGIGGVNTSDQLREVDVPMAEDDRCALTYEITDGFDPDSMVCAGEDTGGADSCQGDSGGPLMSPGAGGALVQVGVVSFGTGCGYPTQYGVYGRVGDTSLHGWITQRTGATGPRAAAQGAAPPATEGGKDAAAAPAAGGSAPAAASPAAPAAAKPAAAKAGKLKVTRVRRTGRRVVARLEATRTFVRVRATLVLKRNGRRRVLSRRSLERLRGTRSVTFRLERVPKGGRLEVEVRGTVAS